MHYSTFSNEGRSRADRLADLTSEHSGSRENRLRRIAARHQILLVKARRPDPRARDHGLFHLVDADTNGIIRANVDVDSVEKFLESLLEENEQAGVNPHEVRVAQALAKRYRELAERD